jgi:hypothetical protein
VVARVLHMVGNHLVGRKSLKMLRKLSQRKSLQMLKKSSQRKRKQQRMS